MDLLTPAGVKMVVLSTVFSFLFMSVLIGKFFYVLPFRKWYDILSKETTPLVLGCIGTASTALLWIGIWLDVEALVLLGAVAATLVWGVLSIGVGIMICIGVVPYMQRLHEKIVAKRTGND